MAATDRIDPAHIAKVIQEKSKEVRDAAEWLSARLEHFEKWIGNLHGRVETVHWIQHPENSPDENDEFGIRLHKSGKPWIISYGIYRPGVSDQVGIDWKPLKEGSIKAKLWAVRMFPDLLTSIERSQDGLIDEIMKAGAEFDAFAEKLGIGQVSSETKAEGK